MKKRIILIVFIVFSMMSYSKVQNLGKENKKIHIGYVDLVVNQYIRNSFCEVYFYKDEKTPYLDLDELLSFMELKELEFNSRERRIYGRINFDEYDKKIDGEEGIIFAQNEIVGGKSTPCNKIYVRADRIGEVLPTKEVKWTEPTLSLKLEFKFDLPRKLINGINKNNEKIEEAKELEERKNKRKVVVEEWKKFTPGILGVRYNYLGVGEKLQSSNLSLNYTNHLLYGNFKISGNVQEDKNRVDTEVNRITWERDVLDDRRIVLGNVYSAQGYSVKSDSGLKGISLSKKNGWNYSDRVTENTIRGYAPSGTTAELYRNSVLIDYQVVRNDEYLFFIRRENNDDYELRLYYSNGKMEKKDISYTNDSQMVPTGTFDYEFQAGETDNKKGKGIYNISTYYGVNDKTTLGLKHFTTYYKGWDYEYLDQPETEIDGSYASLTYKYRDTVVNPLRVNADLLMDLKNDNKLGYKGNLSKKIEGFDLSGDFSDFSQLKYRSNEYKNNKKIRVGNRIKGVKWNLGYENRVLNTDESKDIYNLDLNRTFNNLSTSIRYFKMDKEERLSFMATYYVRNMSLKKYIDAVGLNINSNQSGFSYLGRDFDGDYSVFISKRRASENKFNYRFTYYGGGKNRDRAGLSFAYKFNNMAEIGADIAQSDEVFSSNLNISTNIDFASEKKFKYNHLGSIESTVKGIVYLDDTTLEGGEEKKAIEGVVLKSRSNYGEKIISNKNGVYSFNVSPKREEDIELDLRSDNLDVDYVMPEKLCFKTLPGGLLQLDIPIVRMKTITGYVEFGDKFYLEEIKEIIKHSSIVLKNIKTGVGQKVKLTDEYYIFDVPAGIYQAEIKLDGVENAGVEGKNIFIVDVRGEEDFYDAFNFKILRKSSSTKKYDLELSGSDNFFDNKIYRLSRNSIDIRSDLFALLKEKVEMKKLAKENKRERDLAKMEEEKKKLAEVKAKERNEKRGLAELEKVEDELVRGKENKKEADLVKI